MEEKNLLIDEMIEKCGITLNILQYNEHRAGASFGGDITVDYDIIYIIRGAYEYQINDRRYQVKAGELIVIPQDCYFAGCALEDSTHYFCHFSLSYLLFSEAGICYDKELTQLYYKVCSTKQESFLLRNVIKLILYQQMQQNEIRCLEAIPQGIRKAVNYIDRNPRKNCSGQELAEIANMSYSYFSRRFHECMGVSPMEYRDHVRLEEAKRLLLQGKSVSETAELMGFSDMFSFSKKFKKQYKVAPSKIGLIQI